MGPALRVGYVISTAEVEDRVGFWSGQAAEPAGKHPSFWHRTRPGSSGSKERIAGSFELDSKRGDAHIYFADLYARSERYTRRQTILQSIGCRWRAERPR